MISLKKYLESDVEQPCPIEPDPGELFAAALTSYRSALLAMGKSASEACPVFGSDLQQELAGLEGRLSSDLTPSHLQEVEKRVEEQLFQWGGHSAEHLKAKADEVKDLLIVLAGTAESLGERDQRYASQFNQFTAHLRAVADLENLTQVRASLVRSATELKTCVDQMNRESQQSIAELRAEVSTYETKLRAAEEVLLRDTLTGLANRRNVEERIQWRIANKHEFCVAILDLNHFKLVNDRYGHLAGDSLLKQFSGELKANVRSTDLVGRWGGDEFIVLLDCDLDGAVARMDRIREWAFGEYTIPLGEGAEQARVCVKAAIGVANWASGETMQHLIERADRSMYKEKKAASKT